VIELIVRSYEHLFLLTLDIFIDQNDKGTSE